MWNKIVKFIVRTSYLWLLFLLAIVFFIGVSSFNFATQSDDFVKWLSPDETANYVFAKLYGQEGKLVIYEKFNPFVDDVMHPRSMRSDYGKIKPVSFLGIILIYGSIVKLTSFKILPYLTPFFASLGIFYFYLFIKKLFGKQNAIFSTFILSTFPVYVFYSARSMFHNVLFVVLLIIGLYYAVLMCDKQKAKTAMESKDSFINFKARILNQLRYYASSFLSVPSLRDTLAWLYSGLAGLFFGLAIITRTSELIWIAPLIFILWIFNIKKVGVAKLVFFASFLMLAVIPVLRINQILYGAPFFGGYAEMNTSIVNISKTTTDIVGSTVNGSFEGVKDKFNQLKNYFFFFGFNPKLSVKRFIYYFPDMFPWVFWPAAIGFLLFIQKMIWKREKKYLVYFISYFVVSAILIFYYGSWGFNDNPDPSSHTIGNSYTRYWLPVYLGAIPWISMLILSLSKMLYPKFLRPKPVEQALPLPNSSDKKVRTNFFTFKLHFNYFAFLVAFACLGVISFYSINFVLSGSEEGLLSVARRQIDSKREAIKILQATEYNSAVITLYHDKVLFPERKVVVGLFDDKNMVNRYAKIADKFPTYYYNFTLPEKDIEYLNSRRLRESELEINKVKQINDGFTLYRLSKLQSTTTPN